MNRPVVECEEDPLDIGVVHKKTQSDTEDDAEGVDFKYNAVS